MLGPYEPNQIYCGECSTLMAQLPDECIPFWITSPPYDGLRTYKGYTFDFEAIARQLYRITQPGGVGVWVVADETKNGSESGTSFRQALYFMGLGFNLHDTMIWDKGEYSFPNHTRYENVFEYMFIFSKFAPKSFNPIQQKNVKSSGRIHSGTDRESDGTTRQCYTKPIKQMSNLHNVWRLSPHKSRLIDEHPAIFPEALARDHILSWSNPGDLVFDPMCGSGTSLKMSVLTDRNFLGFDISEEYCELARKRVALAVAQPKLFPFQTQEAHSSYDTTGKDKSDYQVGLPLFQTETHEKA